MYLKTSTEAAGTEGDPLQRIFSSGKVARENSLAIVSKIYEFKKQEKVG